MVANKLKGACSVRIARVRVSSASPSSSRVQVASIVASDFEVATKK